MYITWIPSRSESSGGGESSLRRGKENTPLWAAEGAPFRLAVSSSIVRSLREILIARARAGGGFLLRNCA